MKSRIEIIQDVFGCDKQDAKKYARFEPTLVELSYTLRLSFMEVGQCVSDEMRKGWEWNLRTKL